MLEVAGSIILAYLFITYLLPFGLAIGIIVAVKGWVAIKAVIKMLIKLIEWIIRTAIRWIRKLFIIVPKLAVQMTVRFIAAASIIIMATCLGVGIAFFLHYTQT